MATTTQKYSGESEEHAYARKRDGCHGEQTQSAGGSISGAELPAPFPE